MNALLLHYRNQYSAFFDGEPWYGKSLMALIREIPVEKAYRKPAENSHSIFEILEHLLAWRILFIKKLQGDSKTRIEINSKEDWPPQPMEHSHEHWESLKKRLEKSQEQILLWLENTAPEKLDQPFGGVKLSLADQIAANLQHDVYHTGQVAALNKL